jgi:single-stranded-DNA-specific exonuclease
MTAVVWKARETKISDDPLSIANLTSLYSEWLDDLPCIGAICSRRSELKFGNDNLYDDLLLTHPHGGSYKETLHRITGIISSAIKNNKRILICGDYDVDGMTATACLYLTLTAAGGNVLWNIPTREEGYGIDKNKIESLVPADSVIITCDTGIGEVDDVQYLVEHGYTVIVTDHHLPKEILPNATCIFDPKIYLTESDPEYMVSGCFVAAQVGTQVLDRLHPELSDKYVDICSALISFSIVSDFIELNPQIARQMKYGLIALNNLNHDGIRALLSMCGVSNNAEIVASYLSFSVVPKLNAAGRMNNISAGMDVLLMEEDKSYGKTNSLLAANNLKALNTNRKIVEKQVVEQALDMIGESVTDCLVLYNPTWGSGVIGIVAAKLMNDYGVPVILLTGEGVLHGSGRAPDTVDLHACLTKCSSLLTEYGGHRVAAGVALKQENLDQFKEAFRTAVREYVTDAVITRYVDAEVSIKELFDVRLAMFLNNLEPTGNKNDPVTLQLSSVYVSSILDKGDTTLFSVKDDSQFSIQLSKYRAPEEWKQLSGHKIDILLSSNIRNTFKGVSVEWKIEDIKDYLVKRSN